MTLGGETEDEIVRVDILENQAMDFRNGFVMLCYRDFVSFCSLRFALSKLFLLVVQARRASLRVDDFQSCLNGLPPLTPDDCL